MRGGNSAVPADLHQQPRRLRVQLPRRLHPGAPSQNHAFDATPSAYPLLPVPAILGLVFFCGQCRTVQLMSFMIMSHSCQYDLCRRDWLPPLGSTGYVCSMEVVSCTQSKKLCLCEMGCVWLCSWAVIPAQASACPSTSARRTRAAVSLAATARTARPPAPAREPPAPSSCSTVDRCPAQINYIHVSD
jgi:hypothetical protein